MAPKLRNFMILFNVLMPTVFSGYGSYAMTATKNDLSADTLNAWNKPPCPNITDCTCFPDLKGPILEVDCTNRADDNSSLLADEIGILLKLITPDLTNLVIQYSRLMVVPSSVCQLNKLSVLKLEHNSLATLPENCFTKMTNLKTFSAMYNNLQEIQDGVFSGLTSLQSIHLQSNNISKIGLDTFSHKAGLTGLKDVDLSYNSLTELEPWPFILGQLAPFCVVTFENNQIEAFTNNLQWSYRCGMKPHVTMTLILNGNKIKHVTDLTNGWNITGEVIDMVCLFGPSVHTNLSLSFEDNPYVCDCLDFDVLSICQGHQHVNVLNGVYCDSPPSLAFKRATNVPLDQLVCDVPSPPCLQGCHCMKRPSNRTFVVTCGDLKGLPLRMPNSSNPPPHKAKYVLQFSGSHIKNVDYRDYFRNTYSLDISHSSVTNITDDAWRALTDLSVVDLSSNQLTVFPKILASENLTFKFLSLHDNLWRCECEDRWVRDWLISLGSGLSRPDSVLCYSPENVHGTSIRKASDEQFCYNPIYEKIMIVLKIVLPTVVGCILVTLLIAASAYRWRVRAFVYFKLHPFDVDECENEEMTYDVFLSCAHEDRDIGREIVNRLERVTGGEFEPIDAKLLPKDGYRVCYHERDFTPGVPITENIQRAIERSKRVVCLMSRHFLESEICMIEFLGAWGHHSRIKKRRLVLIKWPEVDCFSAPRLQNVTSDDSEPAEMDLKLFLSTHTYIDYQAADWWQRLVYSLTIQGLPKSVQRNSVQFETSDEITESQSTDNLLVAQ